MKKTLKYVAIVAASFATAACAEEFTTPVENPSTDTFTASIETATKTSISEDYTVWTANDAVTVFTEEKANHQYVLEEGAGSNVGAFAAAGESALTKVAAVYPYHKDHAYDGSTFTVQVPAEHEYVEGEINKAPMVGTFADGKVAFKNAGALIRVDAKNIPAGYNKAVLTSADVNLSGEMTIKSSKLIAGTYSEDNNSVAITWTAGEKPSDMVFYFPVPVAKFAKLTVTLTNGIDSYLVKERANITTARNTCYRMTSDAEEIFIKNEDDLFAFAKRVADGNTYDGQEVKLAADITMTQPWTPIGNSIDGVSKSFRGTFDGQGHTISNLNVTADSDAGFFGAKWDGDVRNVKFDNATISGHHYAGVVVGWADGNNYNSFFKIDGCEVTNSTVTLTPELIGEEYDNGDKAGAFVGYAYAINVTGNTVSNTTITGYRDLGGIVGCAAQHEDKVSTITGNTVGENVKVVVDNTHNYKNYTDNSSYNLGSYCGRPSANAVVENNTGDAELVYPTVKVYMKPSSGWVSNAKSFAAYVWNDSGNTWYEMTDIDEDGVYEAAISIDYNNIIFVSKTAAFVADWNNKYQQTTDLVVPTDNNNAYVIYNSEWTTLAEAQAFEEPAKVCKLIVKVSTQIDWYDKYIYCWTSGSNTSGWPGTKLTWDKQDGNYYVYYHDFPYSLNGKKIEFCISNGNGGALNQTNDLSVTLNGEETTVTVAASDVKQ